MFWQGNGVQSQCLIRKAARPQGQAVADGAGGATGPGEVQRDFGCLGAGGELRGVTPSAGVPVQGLPGAELE